MGVGVTVRMGAVGVRVGETVSVKIGIGVGVRVDGMQELKEIVIASHAAAFTVWFIIHVSRCEVIAARFVIGVGEGIAGKSLIPYPPHWSDQLWGSSGIPRAECVWFGYFDAIVQSRLQPEDFGLVEHIQCLDA